MQINQVGMDDVDAGAEAGTEDNTQKIKGLCLPGNERVAKISHHVSQLTDRKNLGPGEFSDCPIPKRRGQDGDRRTEKTAQSDQGVRHLYIFQQVDGKILAYDTRNECPCDRDKNRTHKQFVF